MAAINDPWHFPRPDLARRLLFGLTDGPARALTMFAPRRTGKTEFLLKDFAPLASRERHRVVYVSFWEAPAAPLALLLHALETSLKGGRLTDRLRSGAAALAPKLALSAPLPGTAASVEIDLGALDVEPPAELLLYLGDLLERVSDAGHPTMLLLDEVQELARDERHRPLVAALRTALDVRSDRLRAIFTGSSQTGLRSMFSHREAPFFHFGTPLDLPALGRPFVDHLVAVHGRITDEALDADAAFAMFERLHSNPYFFRLAMETLVLDPAVGPDEAEVRVRDRAADELGYDHSWLALEPLQRAVLAELALGTERPFAADTRASIGARLGDGEAPSSARVQGALKRLERRRLIDRLDGTWRVADPGLAEWVREFGDL